MSLLPNQITLDEYNNQIQQIHVGANGYITIANKTKDAWEQWHYNIDDLVKDPEQIIKKENAYISQNTFYTTYRRIDTIKELRALYIDIDCYNTQYSKEQVIMALRCLAKDREIPRANLVIDSGQGINAIWTIKKAPCKALALWYAIQRYFFKKLQEYGADPKALDPARVLRIAGTTNTKSNTEVKIIDRYEYKYELREIQREYLPELETRQKKKGRPKKIVSLYNEYSLYHARLLDLVQLCELRNWDIQGYREFTLFLYRYWSCHYTKEESEALRQALELNSQFIEPLQEREVIRDTKSAETAFKSENREYKYKNETLIEKLAITEYEQRQLKSIIGKTEKYRRKNEKRTPRNENGLTKRQQSKEDKLKMIKEMIKKGYTNAEMAHSVDLSIRQIQRIKKEIQG